MDIKRQLTSELASIVKTAVRENRSENVDILPSDIINSVCSVIEAIFIHGLKEVAKNTAARIQIQKKKLGKPSYPEPNFWPFLEKFTHRDIRAQIANLNQIKTDIGRGRAWIRIALNDRVLENYMNSILREEQIIRHYYNQRSYLRDTEQCDLMVNYMRALSKLTFTAPLNSSILNEWTPTPLKLAGLLIEKRTPNHSVGSTVDMEDIMESDENSDVAVAISALEYDGYDEPSMSEYSDVRSESQFSLRSRPVAAYGDKKMLFSPEGSGSDFQDNIMASRNRRGELTNINESIMDEDNDQKLNAVLCTIGVGTQENEENNPFVDSGVVTSSSNWENAVIIHRHHQNHVKQKILNQSIDASTSIDGDLQQKNARDEPMPTSENAEEEKLVNGHLEMSFSPGNSLAAHGWSSPTYEPGQGASSPSTTVSSMKSDRARSNSFGNPGGFAALFSAVLNTSKCKSEGGSAGTSYVDNQVIVNGEDHVIADQTTNMDMDDTGRNMVKDDSKESTPGEISVVHHHELKLNKSASSSLDNFVVVEESQENLDQAAAQKSFRLSLLTKMADQSGLDVQGFKCHSCQRTIGLPLFGTFRICTYDGHYYCAECHLNDEKIIPARVLFNWDFKPKPVSRASKAFLDLITDQPIIDMQKTNPTLPDIVKAMKKIKMLRLQLSYVAMYLLTCKESVGEDLRKRVWPKEYLYSNIDLYSVSDLMDVHTGQMQKHLKSVIQYAVRHVLQQCRLCAQKGFICELCNDRKIIYAFQLDVTHRCPKCHAVYHTKCVDNQKQMTCPKCVRRELYMKQAERSSLNLDHVLPLGV